ncbi:MAG: hypothetical protein CVU13_10975 [Bacteroidetes bacterium HGW-Bacteroidetes-8]|jgi:hypothetical protein|nr:MAG: hypothetical protein CVU13_10975 [Bacteroidetes bacterium HGW-Bacteroidetes-8]
MGKLIKSLLITLLAGASIISASTLGAEVFELPNSLTLQNGNSEQDELQRVVTIPRGRRTIYQLLGKISEQTGLLFIYDSKIVENDKKVAVNPGEYSLEEAVKLITDNRDLKIKIEENYILLFLPSADVAENLVKQADEREPSNTTLPDGGHFTLTGTIKDRMTDEPIEFATVGVDTKPYGTVSNLNGEFIFTLPDSLIDSHIKISHLGYQSRLFKASLLAGQRATFYLDQRIIPLQEIVVRAIDPSKTIREMIAARVRNYNSEPLYLTAFYREGIEYKNNISLSEAVLKIYKTGVVQGANSEQVKVLKMRRLASSPDKDTLVTKIKSSINSSLLLDLVKNLPDFLLPQANQQYNFSHTDITVIDDRRVYVISFEQKEEITAPLFRGKLYIDAGNWALTQARFEVNPTYVGKATDDIIVKQSRKVEIIPERVEYIVSYKSHNGVYTLNHVRGDLTFRVRPKRKLFSSNLHVWFEMVNCKTESTNVTPIPREERISTREIFSEISYSYDKDFWGNFNVILPEENLKDFIKRYAF